MHLCRRISAACHFGAMHPTMNWLLLSRYLLQLLTVPSILDLNVWLGSYWLQISRCLTLMLIIWPCCNKIMHSSTITMTVPPHHPEACNFFCCYRSLSLCHRNLYQISLKKTQEYYFSSSDYVSIESTSLEIHAQLLAWSNLVLYAKCTRQGAREREKKGFSKYVNLHREK